MLARPLSGVPSAEDFSIRDAEVRPPAPGECLARVVYLSLDPYLRSAIAGRHIGHVSLGIGDVIPGRAVAQVVASQRSDASVGAYVELETGWQQYATTSAPIVRTLA